jgi:hypothetical protein
MTTLLCHINAHQCQKKEIEFIAKPQKKSMYIKGQCITGAKRQRHNRVIVRQLTSNIIVTIMCVHQVTNKRCTAKLHPTIITTRITNAPLSTKMRNTATCLDHITLVPTCTALWSMTLLKSARPQERVTIHQCLIFVRVSPMLKSTTIVSIASCSIRTTSIRSLIVAILILRSSLPISFIWKMTLVREWLFAFLLEEQSCSL